jgi:hypothetical protein
MSHKAPFPNPLDEATLAAFCHPVITHALARPVRTEKEIIAANGYLCLRAHRGRWFDEEFQEPACPVRARIDSLPWKRFEILPEANWFPLDDVRGDIYRQPPIGFWAVAKDSSATGKPAPTPIWKCGTCSPVRLSLLQLIARLPRCEVFTGSQDSSQPLFFRCSGARGIIAADPRLTTTSWKIFQPRFDQMDNCMVHQRKKDPTPWIQKTLKPGDRQTWSPTLPGQRPWPPPEPID